MSTQAKVTDRRAGTRIEVAYGTKTIPDLGEVNLVGLCSVRLLAGHATILLPGERGHYHKATAEDYIFMADSSPATLELNGQRHSVEPGAVAVIPPGVVHNLLADRGGDVEFLVVTTPKYRPEDSFDVFEGEGNLELPTVFGRVVEPSFERVTRNTISIIDDPVRTPGRTSELTRVTMPPHGQFPTRCHDERQEVLAIFAGTGTLTLDGVDYRVSEGNIVAIPPHVSHTVAAGQHGLDFLLICAVPHIPAASSHSLTKGDVK